MKKLSVKYQSNINTPSDLENKIYVSIVKKKTGAHINPSPSALTWGELKSPPVLAPLHWAWLCKTANHPIIKAVYVTFISTKIKILDCH